MNRFLYFAAFAYIALCGAIVARKVLNSSGLRIRTVDTVVSRIRRKLEIDPDAPELIVTAWGVGYKFADV